MLRPQDGIHCAQIRQLFPESAARSMPPPKKETRKACARKEKEKHHVTQFLILFRTSIHSFLAEADSAMIRLTTLGKSPSEDISASLHRNTHGRATSAADPADRSSQTNSCHLFLPFNQTGLPDSAEDPLRCISSHTPSRRLHGLVGHVVCLFC